MSFTKNLALLVLPLILYGCASGSRNQDQGENSVAQSTVEVDSSKIFADSAMALLVEVNEYVAKGIKNEMPNEEVNSVINPKMEKYFTLYGKLKPEDTLRVYQFRIDKLNEIIDLQMEYSN